PTDPRTTDIHTLSLHDALPISKDGSDRGTGGRSAGTGAGASADRADADQYGNGADGALGRLSAEYTLGGVGEVSVRDWLQQRREGGRGRRECEPGDAW